MQTALLRQASGRSADKLRVAASRPQVSFFAYQPTLISIETSFLRWSNHSSSSPHMTSLVRLETVFTASR
jgi:hypothetical protein